MDIVPSDETKKLRGLGAFRILRRLPASSRDVFLAVDADGKNVVLKVFDAPARNQGLFDPKIADEASAYARLSHPNIVKVVDMFSADGQFVIALEYVEGSTLSVVRAELQRDGRPVPDECWLYVAWGVFAALAEAHGAKDIDGKLAPLLHRSVNPSNVLVGWDGAVKLGNFNVAHTVRVLRDSNPGFTWGSYGYFAPEQVKLEPSGPQTDVYSASLMLWELLAGRKGIERASLPDAELLKAMATPNFTPLEKLRHDVDPRVRYAVRAGLEPNPKKRFVGAARIRDVLHAAIDMDAARAKLVEVLVRVRHPAPPSIPVDEALSLPPTIEAELSLPTETLEPSAPLLAELAAVPVAPPRAPPPPPPVPVHAAPPHAPPLPPHAPPSLTLPDAPATPLGLEVEVAPNPAPALPILSPFADIRARRRRRTAMIAALASFGLAACILVVALVVAARTSRSSAATAAPRTTATASTSTTPAATATVEPVVVVAAVSPPVPSSAPSTSATMSSMSPTQGEIVPPASAAGHRLFVDGHFAGDGSKPLVVACGHHTLRVGSGGKRQTIDVPCGGSLALP